MTDEITNREFQGHSCSVSILRLNRKPDSKLLAQLPAQIEPHSGRTLPPSSVASGKSFVKDSGAFLFLNADTIVLYRQQHSLFCPFCSNPNQRMFLPVFYTVQDHLIQNELNPLAIRIDQISAFHFCLHMVLDQQKTVLFQHFACCPIQIGFCNPIILINLIRSGIIKYHIHIVFNPLILHCNNFVCIVSAFSMILANHGNPGNRPLDLMYPAFDILLIVPLRILNLPDALQ